MMFRRIVVKLNSLLNIRNKSALQYINVLHFSTLPELSAITYNTKRKDFNEVTDDHISYFKHSLGSSRVLTNVDDILPFNIDWFKNCRGQSRVVLKPKTTKEISAILAFCNENNLAVCPQGGNTGVVGGSVPVFDEIIISMALMNQIINIDNRSGVLVCEAGCILETLDSVLKEYDLMVPLDLGAKGNCHIGGNVSTNAGGLRLLRYGNLQGSVLGIEAVKANGDIIDCISTLKKDNTGYHLKNLFIGSEGTLGIVTKVSIKCVTFPKSVRLAFLGVENYESVLNIFLRAKSVLGEILSAFEMTDLDSMEASIRAVGTRHPIEKYPFYVLIETHGSNEAHDLEKLETFLVSEMASGLIANGLVVSEESKVKKLWALRDQLSVAIMREGYTLNYDISLPLVYFYDIVVKMKHHLRLDPVRVYGYGHIGDGNVHVQISMKNHDKNIVNKIEPYIFELTTQLKGSISAEHGMGYKKANYMHMAKSPSSIQLMKEIKQLMDPKGILNPYKVLPE